MRRALLLTHSCRVTPLVCQSHPLHATATLDVHFDSSSLPSLFILSLFILSVCILSVCILWIQARVSQQHASSVVQGMEGEAKPDASIYALLDTLVVRAESGESTE